MDDPGLIFFEEVSLLITLIQCDVNQSFADQIRSQHDLHHWARARQIFHSGYVQKHFRRAKISNHCLHSTRVCGGVDRQLLDISPLHLLPDHRLHRTLLQQQLRRNGAHVFSSVSKYGQNSSYRSSTRTLRKIKLTMLIVYGCNRRHCHSHPSDPYGHEHQDGIEEEIGGHLHAHIGRGVS
jgi:hypothetical protein